MTERISTERRLAWATWYGAACLLTTLLLTYPALTNRLTAAEPEPKSADVRLEEPPLDESARDHWSFRPLRRAIPPQVERHDWPLVRGVDEFVLHEHERRDLPELPRADRAALLRRLRFDLTGLPPTLEELEEWQAVQEPDDVERLVDRLLASPAYGIRQGQRWLDLARFAETDGFEHDHERPQAWRYRDWVVDALNRDLPYPEFVRQQIAGDLLAPQDSAALVATGFLLCGPDMPDLNLQDERRHQVLNEITSTVGAVLLGLQFGCAECHDHKDDPISSGDYYRLRAFFEPLDIFMEHPLPDGTKGARIVREGPARESRVMLRGDFRRPGPPVRPEIPRIARMPHDDPQTTGVVVNEGEVPRARLARWLTAPLPPLAARAAVNRVWQDVFGQALAGTPNDLGTMGEWPTNVELLDWLAADWSERGASLKELRRALFTSATYRQASRATGLRNARQVDPHNAWLYGMNRRRLDGEALRDSLLAVAGRLDHRFGGPGVRPPVPAELAGTLLKNQWTVSPEEADHARRSLYLFVRRNLRFPILEAFDRPDTSASCATRLTSTTAPQALTLMNSTLTLDVARHLAARSEAATDSSTARIDWLIRTVYGRTATAHDRRAIVEFLDSAADRDQAVAWRDVCRALLNASEFVYVD